MNILEKHEVFEVEVLDRLKNAMLLEPLVFGGGTMLRLCHELNRSSVDLDFWFAREVEPKAYFEKVKKCLEKEYELIDAHIKFYTLLLETRSANYPKRLKIEIRKGVSECDSQDRIAFSKYSTLQVLLRVKTLEQMMKDKLGAALERKEVRDFFDIEFLLRRGVPITADRDILVKLVEIIGTFKENDYKVILGALLDSATRKYYIKNRFTYLLQKINAIMSGLF